MVRVLVIAAVLAGGTVAAPTAFADPIPALCFDDRLCSDDFGSATFCPDTGRWVGPFAACESLVTGGYRPGGQRPNASSWDSDDEW